MDILIIGGGIAGLTAALALQRQSTPQRPLRVRLFEQAPAFGEVGAGITLSQPASRGLFWLGLQGAIEAAADIPVRAGGAHFETGERLPGPDHMALARAAGEIPYFYQLHRADLHRILSDAVMAADPATIHLGRSFAGLTQDATGVTAHFTDGSSARGDILLGADGINSAVRAQLFGAESPRFTGQVAYRFLVPAQTVRPYLHLGPSVNYIGPNRGLLRYLIRHGELVNGVAFVRTDSWTGEGWSTPVETEELLEKFAGWCPDVQGLLQNAPREGTRKWALFDRDPLDGWTQGRVTLLGDAAHPMLPFLGLGAAMGIEDGVVLGRAIGAGADPVAALARYEATRRGRANGVLLASRRQGEIMQARDGVTRRNSTQNDDLMRYDPATVALAA
ncbi:MAG TPA: FAD-dependent monooxygenase [Novosphingobium sp.]|nr:FAD-dependent monooxygenase [Novosphingobium sp.]